MAWDLLIRGGTIVSPDGLAVGDLAVKDGRIAAVGANLGDAAELVDARGLYVLPGLVDTQVHFREPGLEHKEDLETGTRAAIAGGVTTILEMPNTNPTTTTPEALADKIARATGRAWCDFGFFFGATTENAETLAEAERLPGTPGIKMFVGSSTGSLLVESDADIERVLRHGVKRVAIHSEDEPRNRAARAAYTGHDPADHPRVRDAESARLATERLLRLGHATGRPLHILHISTLDELPLLADAKAAGVDVTCEVTPQHLWFCADDYARLGTRIQQNPPIRSREHRDAIRAALAAGLFDVFGSDHAPHTLEEKARPYPDSPSGMPGVQTMLPVLSTLAARGLFDWPTLVRMACARPASLYGLAKGTLSVGADADLVLFDPARRWTFAASDVVSKCGWSPFEGEEFTGQAERVFLRGRGPERGLGQVASNSVR